MTPAEGTARRFSTRRKLLIGGCAVLAVGGGWVAIDTAHDDSTDVAAAKALRKTIEGKGGFTLVTDALQQRIGPSVVLPDRPVKLTDLGPRQLGPLRSLDAALALYPPDFIKRFLDVVAIAGDIIFWSDTPAGGFFFPRGLCLNYGRWSAANQDTARDIFHHEFSSLVRLAVPTIDARWTALNPPGFQYLTDAAYRQLLKTAPHETGNPSLYGDGFTRPYGMSSADDDWNTYAEQVFGHPTAFAALIEPYERMRAKTAIMIAAYQDLDPRFAPYFESTGLRSASAPR